MNITHYFRGTWSWQYYILHPWVYLSDLWKDARAFIQRGRRGWADCDAWNFDDYLSDVLPAAIQYLRDISHSYPSIGDADTPEKWDAVLGKIARGFGAWKEIGDVDTDWHDEELMARLNKEHEEGMALFAEWFGHLWD